jgi:hypothetical protein
MPVEVVGEVIGGIVEVAVSVAGNVDSNDEKRGCGCLGLILIGTIIIIGIYCFIKF